MTLFKKYKQYNTSFLKCEHIIMKSTDNVKNLKIKRK